MNKEDNLLYKKISMRMSRSSHLHQELADFEK